MKVVTPVVFVLALTAGAFAAEEKRADSVTPQPRVRLALTPQGAVAQVEKPAKPEANIGTLMMDKVVVTDSKLAGPWLRPLEPEPKKFSLLRGGPMFEGRIGSLPFAVGLWAWDDLFKEDAKFRPQKTRIEVDFLRIKW
jgi:hypothetical protein